MNRNKKTKNKKVNDAIANMENSTSFQSINDINSSKSKDKNNIPEVSN
ncbi:hypothetical protein K2F40_14485 [Clostridium sp. CM028]|nr:MULTISPECIES: hypothetical protein [unclassified Clostridium]MBU3091309.1 hypothetical protein [Clostridium sp. CF011]MBW9150167.1 hypothetical protein [Clostridium sp. CM028]WAG68617.1 hypothetical protein LL036_10925 [Clostridium sp. CF011]WLC60411.1 hypothetical protein KTC94_09325 [Clostridium sp. CM028]